MLGLFLIYFIGKSFFNIKEQSNRGKWGYAILGIVTYYGGAFVGAFILGIILTIYNPDAIDSIHDRVWDLIALPFGILACWGLHKYLKAKAEKSAVYNESDVLDENLVIEEKV
jgi:hypothetical protein